MHGIAEGVVIHAELDSENATVDHSMVWWCQRSKKKSLILIRWRVIQPKFSEIYTNCSMRSLVGKRSSSWQWKFSFHCI